MIKKRKSHNLGRPTSAEVDKAQFRQKVFYFPLRFEHIWKEFDRITRQRIKNSTYPERCKSIAVRRLIFRYIIKHTNNPAMITELRHFISEEDNRLEAMESKYRGRLIPK